MQRFTFHTDSREYLVRNNGCAGHNTINQGHDLAGATVRRLRARDFDLFRVCESVIAAECALRLSSQPLFSETSASSPLQSWSREA